MTRSNYPKDKPGADAAEEHDESGAPTEFEQKQMALESILDAWDDALAEGVSSDILATTALFAALSDMVDVYGEDAVADMADSLADRVRAGEFSLHKMVH